MFKKFFVYLLGLFAVVGNVFSMEQNSSEFRMVILGLGGRSQHILLNCLELNKNIKVVAVCDDHGVDSLKFFLDKLQQRENPLLDSCKESFKDVSFYPDDTEGLKSLFENHKNIDGVLITSANYNHFRHLNAVLTYSSCKNIYTEKPLFISLEEFTHFNSEDKAHVLVGLTLRYSSMAKIVVQKLQEYKGQLGELKQVRAWERVRFCQALTSFMMSWRRYISRTGGLLLEKSIHDLDLALFFIQSLGINPQEISLSTKSSHDFFTYSQKEKILHEILHNDALKPTLVGRDLSGFQRIIPFSFAQDGSIDWTTTLDAIFEELPRDDNFSNSDILPDYHKLNATIKTASDSTVDFELEVVLGGFRPTTERGMKFVFEHGEVAIDVMKSSMIIRLHNGAVHEFDLQTNNSDHADGDEFISQSILGTLSQEQYVARFNDPIVQLATMMGLVSEKQALGAEQKGNKLKKAGSKWVMV